MIFAAPSQPVDTAAPYEIFESPNRTETSEHVMFLCQCQIETGLGFVWPPL